MEMDVISLVGKLKQKYNSANPFTICEKMDIQIRYVPFLNNPKGQFQELLGRSVILLNHELKYSEERFYICAHELGHAIFHQGLSRVIMSLLDPPEANQKAKRIALPPILLFLFIKKIMINTLEKLKI